MCGRYAVYSDEKIISKIFSIKQPFNFELSYNVAPTENVSVICELPDHHRIVTSMRWGLIPSWQKLSNSQSVLINARIESINSKPSFKQAVKRRRCLIVADGFFEWQKVGEKLRQPYFIHRKDKLPFALAGIWDKWADETRTIDSCAIITMEANDILSPLHNRMPAIVKPDDYNEWLNPNNHDWNEIKTLITEEPYLDLTYHKVSTKVNSALYKGSDCISTIN